MSMIAQRIRPLLFSLLLAEALCAWPALAQVREASYTTRVFYWENDFKITDEQYTNGLRYAWSTVKPSEVLDLTTRETERLRLRERAPLWVWLIDGALPRFSLDEVFPVRRRESPERGWQWATGGALGQNFYTPEDIERSSLIPNDRPYAGWLYFGSSVQWSRLAGPVSRPVARQHYAELDLGIVGPFSFSDEVQRVWHEQIDSKTPGGWDHQVERIPSVVLLYNHRRQLFPKAEVGPFEMDLSGMIGGAAGNVFNYANAGGELRIGRGLSPGFALLPVAPVLFDPAAFSAPSTRLLTQLADSVSNLERSASPSAESSLARERTAEQSNYEGGPKPFEFYAFGRVSGRGVLSNFLIEGSDEHVVERRAGVLDVNFGVALRRRWLLLTVQHVTRSPEFEPSVGWHNYNSFTLTLLPKALYGE